MELHRHHQLRARTAPSTTRSTRPGSDCSSISGYTVTFDGNAHTASGSCKGVDGNPLAGLDKSGTTHTNAGTYNADPWAFTDVTGNYNDTSGTVNDKINQASADCSSISGYTVTFDGNAHTATGSCKDLGGGDLLGLDKSGTTHTNAGTYNADPWSFAGTTNYAPKNGTVNDKINKAKATIKVDGYSVTYDGNAHTATGTATGVGGADLSNLLGLGGTTHTNAGTYNADPWTFAGNDNYEADSGTVNDAIGKRSVTASVTADDKTYDGTVAATITGCSLDAASGNTGKLGGDNVGCSASGGAFGTATAGTGKTVTANVSLSGTAPGNYQLTSNSAQTTTDIWKKQLSINAENKTKTYADDDPAGTATYAGFVGTETPATAAGWTGSPACSIASHSENVGTYSGVITCAAGLSLDATNYKFATGSSGNLTITIRGTSTALTVVPATVQYSDASTFTAIVSSTGDKYGAPLAGSVQFKLDGANWGAPVALQPDRTAKISEQLLTSLGAHNVTAVFTSATGNYGDSTSAVKTVTVTQENATPVGDTAYTGETVFWTPTDTSNAATVTLAATVLDASDGAPGNVTKATISFFTQDSAGTKTLINGATNLPVGLIDPFDHTKGTASATLQYSLKAGDICTELTVGVRVGGSYTMVEAPQYLVPISICRATLGSIIGNGSFANDGSSGYLAGDATNSSSFSFDVKYNKSGTNPQGKVFLYVDTKRKPDGTLDTKVHTYQITSNAISTLSVTNGSAGAPSTASFSAKTNVVELNPDGTTTPIDSGNVMQLAITDGPAGDTVAFTVQKSRGGLWFSSKWDGVKTIERAIKAGGSIRITPA